MQGKKKSDNRGKDTVVRGLRAEQSFWDMCDTVALMELITRNELIIRVVIKYCEDKLNGRKGD